MTASPSFAIRSYRPADAETLNALALRAFAQFRHHYAPWKAFAAGIGAMSELARSGELMVAENSNGALLGGVGYFGPTASKPDFFKPDWSIIRMLVVDPAARGRGVGRRLTEACLGCAARDGASVIALHTTPIMEVALAMYLRLGFVRESPGPTIYGVPYDIYVRRGAGLEARVR
jgi:ribosomal protein S18 acetylase RimI-like enzyme